MLFIRLLHKPENNFNLRFTQSVVLVIICLSSLSGLVGFKIQISVPQNLNGPGSSLRP